MYMKLLRIVWFASPSICLSMGCGPPNDEKKERKSQGFFMLSYPHLSVAPLV
jgi:hypothetical protein